MRMRDRKRHRLDVNLTPLIDVVFLLLIFFMVSTTFKKQTALGVELPDVASSHTTMSVESIEVEVDIMGNYQVNGHPLAKQNSDSLKQALAGLNKERPLIILGDKLAPYQAIVTALDVAKQLERNNVQILAKES